MAPDRSLLDIVGVGQDLEELLDRRVDVLTGASLHPAPRQHPGRVATAVKDERVYLSHSRDAITDIEEYTSVNRDAFMATRMRQDARHSEARDHSRSRKLSICDQRPSFGDPVKADRRYADRLTHHYFSVDLALVWRVVERDLPALKAVTAFL
jgi:uncharacterized protein with HEPN domain